MPLIKNQKLGDCHLVRKKVFLILGVILIFGGVFLVAKPVYSIGALIQGALAIIFYLISSFLGWLCTIIIHQIVHWSQFNIFINAEGVVTGWSILRDIANMFFILILLVIAFATVLKQEKYSYKTLLAPLLMMAVLVNFSKTICGLVIDFAQVIMLSFVNAFKDIGASNFIKLLNLDKLVDFLTSELPGGNIQRILITILTGGADITRIFSSLLNVFLTFITLIILLIILAILILRIVSLWILIVLSPLAFVFYVLPGTQKYAKQWQDKFVHQVIVGPVLAFFLWLTFYTLTLAQDVRSWLNKFPVFSVIIGTKAAQPAEMASFFIGIGMLIGTLFAAQQLGVAGASLAGKGISFLQKAGAKPFQAAGKGIKYGTGIAKDWITTKLGESKLPFLSSAFWRGIQERFKERREEADLRATGAGYAFAEGLRRRGGKEAAALARKRYEQRIIETQMRKEYEAWGALGYGREQLAEILKSALLTGGREGDLRRQAILQMASRTGNIDDLYELALQNNWHKDPRLFKGLTDEERKRLETMDEIGFNQFYRGVLGLKGDYFPEWIKENKKEEVEKLAKTKEIQDKASEEFEKQIRQIEKQSAAIKEDIKSIEDELRKMDNEIKIKTEEKIKAEIKTKVEAEIEKKKREEKKEKLSPEEIEKIKKEVEKEVKGKKPEIENEIKKEYKYEERKETLTEQKNKLEEILQEKEKEKEKVDKEELARDLASARIAKENAFKASSIDQERMRTLYAITQNVENTGHFPEAAANLDPHTGKYYIMDSRERFESVFGEFAKRKGRDALAITTPFNSNVKVVDPTTGEVKWDASYETKNYFQIYNIINYPRDLFRELHHWAPRVAPILLGVEGWVRNPFFDRFGRLIPGREKEFYKVWALNPALFAHAWRVLFRGGAMSGSKEERESLRPWEVKGSGQIEDTGD